jgi:acetoin utilization deacetylase AcuC-like enzyme
MCRIYARATGPMERTGIFYHPSFSRRSYLTVGRRLADFPQALEPLLQSPRFALYECQPASDELILQVHTRALIAGVEQDTLCATARHSAGGVVEAMERVWAGELRNAFCFIGAGGHHAGREFFGGFCCFNDVAIAIEALRTRRRVRRFAILDTDAHHGDGTRDIYEGDPEVLHVCLCASDYVSEDETNVDVAVPDDPWGTRGTADERYLQAAREAFTPRGERFRPDLLIWYFGFDGHQGDYGDMGLSIVCYLGLADLMVGMAERLTRGKLLVVLGGGSRTDLATRIIPPLIARLAGPREARPST